MADAFVVAYDAGANQGRITHHATRARAQAVLYPDLVLDDVERLAQRAAGA